MELVQTKIEAKTNVNNGTQFQIGDMSIVMDILTRLYSNPIQTLVQEYICNGRDATREAGTDKPIHITVPSTFAPEFIVRDFGVGLSKERIETVFLLYGTSTKRSNNGQTGGFGIGAKSAWAYTDSFTVTSYLDGQKNVYVCHKSGGNGNMTQLESTATDEPNGVEIRIPVNNKDIDKFVKATRRAVFFWEKELPTSNIELSHFNDEKISDNFAVNSGSDITSIVGYNNELLVIDGIPYPVNFLSDCGVKKIDNRLNSDRKIFFMDNGKVEIAPSREEIIASDKSKAALSIIIDKESVNLQKFIDNIFKDCVTDMDRLKLVKQYEGEYKLNTYLGGYTWSRLTGWSRRLSRYGYTKDGFHDGMFLYCTIDITGKITKEKSRGFTTDIPMYFNDTDESAVTLNKRIRKLNRQIMLVNKDQFDDFDHYKTQLNILPISSLPLPVKVARTKTQVSTTKVCMHFLSNYGNYTSKYELISYFDGYYIEMSNRYKHKDIAKLIKENGHEVVAVSQTVFKKLAKSPTAKHYTEFMKTYKPCNKTIESFIAKENIGCGLEAWVRKGYTLKGFKTQPKYKQERYQFTDSVIDTIKLTKEYKEFKKNDTINKNIASKLPLLVSIDSYSRRTNRAAIQEYINWKLGV